MRPEAPVAIWEVAISEVAIWEVRPSVCLGRSERVKHTLTHQHSLGLIGTRQDAKSSDALGIVATLVPDTTPDVRGVAKGVPWQLPPLGKGVPP